MGFSNTVRALLGAAAVALAALSAGCYPTAKALATGQKAGRIAADGRDVFFVAGVDLFLKGTELRAVPNRGGKVRTVHTAPKDRRITEMKLDRGELFFVEIAAD